MVINHKSTVWTSSWCSLNILVDLCFTNCPIKQPTNQKAVAVAAAAAAAVEAAAAAKGLISRNNFL